MSRKIKTIDQKSLFRCRSGGYWQHRIPGILRLPGCLLLTCEGRAANCGDWGDIDVIVSRMEDGAEPEMVLKIGESTLPPDGTMRTYSNPTLIPDGDNVHLIYHKNYEQAFIITSQDGGKSWGESREITDCYREFPYVWNVCATGPGHGIQLKSGRLVAPVWLANGKADGQRREHAPSVCGCIYSDDHGQTWHAGGLASGDEIENGSETTVVELSDNRLLFNHRNTNADKHRVLSDSFDAGEHLENIRSVMELQDPVSFGSMTLCEYGILFANCNSQDGRENLTVKLSTDEGKSWEPVWEAEDVCGYPDIAADGDMVYLFYEHPPKDQSINAENTLKIGRFIKEN